MKRISVQRCLSLDLIFLEIDHCLSLSLSFQEKRRNMNSTNEKIFKCQYFFPNLKITILTLRESKVLGNCITAGTNVILGNERKTMEITI